MISGDKEECFRIHEIYNRSIKAFDNTGFTSNFDLIDIIDLNKLASTYHVKVPGLETSILYWKFLDSWIQFMNTGKWVILPRMWFDTVVSSKYTDPLQEYQVNTEYNSYLQKRKAMCQSLNLCHLPVNDSLVKLHWLRAKGEEASFVSVPHIVMRMYLSVNDLEIEGVRNRAYAEHASSFNAADQSIWPTEGGTKMETLDNQLKQPILRHQKFI